MTNASVIPDTNTVAVAALAVAWDIVKTTHVGNLPGKSPDMQLKETVNAVIKAYLAMLSQKAIAE